MKVKIRHIDDAIAVDFCECAFNEIQQVIQTIEEAGGFYSKGGQEPFHSYQLIYEERKEAYVEILIGKDGE